MGHPHEDPSTLLSALLLAGDFNSTPSGFPARADSSVGTNSMDHLLAPGRFRAFPGITRLLELEHLTFPLSGPQRVIDWILAPEGNPVFDLQMHRHPWSDRCLINASVRLSD